LSCGAWQSDWCLSIRKLRRDASRPEMSEIALRPPRVLVPLWPNLKQPVCGHACHDSVDVESLGWGGPPQFVALLSGPRTGSGSSRRDHPIEPTRLTAGCQLPSGLRAPDSPQRPGAGYWDHFWTILINHHVFILTLSYVWVYIPAPARFPLARSVLKRNIDRFVLFFFLFY